MANIRPLIPPELELDWKHNGLPAKKVETVRELIRMLKKLDGSRPVQVAAIRPTVFVEENLIFPDNPTPRVGFEVASLDIVVAVDNEQKDGEDGGAVFIVAG
jgi:hypothetical protein